MTAVRLSPLTRRDLFARYVERMEAPEPKPAKTRRIVEVTMYRCPECSELHDWESDAEDCCAPDDPPPPPAENDPGVCPVCAATPPLYEDAADCCLWRDFDHPTRLRIAMRVQQGASWTDAIAEVAR